MRSTLLKAQGLAEYGVILALILLVAVAALVFLGGQITQILNDVGKKL